MARSPWHVFATRVHGDGTETLLATDLPLTGLSLTRALSGPGGLSGQIPLEVARLATQPVFVPWATGIYAERDGLIMGGGFLGDDSITEDGPSLSLVATGVSAYPAGIHYDGDSSWVDTDPAVLFRHGWDHVQSQPGGNIGLVLDDLVTPVRVGEEETDVEFTTEDGEEVAFTAGPVKWNWWSTHDLGQELSRLAEATPFDYLEHHYWDGDQVAHRLQLGYPRIGVRRPDLRFVVGENVTLNPTVTFAQWASEVVAIGAGEGRKMARGTAWRAGAPALPPTTPHSAARALVGGQPAVARLRRPVVIVDKSLQSHAAASKEAAAELAWLSGQDETTSITVRNHSNAPLWGWSPGDEVLLQGAGVGWSADLHLWVRILSDEINPVTDTAVLTVTRAEGG